MRCRMLIYGFSMTLLLIGLVLFIGFHSFRIVAPQQRLAVIELFGVTGWRIVHSIVSIVALVVLVSGFVIARQDPTMLWYPPVWTRHLAATLMIFAMVLAVASAFPAGRIKEKAKFPLTAAVKIWAFSHLLANGTLSSVVLFVAFLAWAVVLRIALKRAVARGELSYPVFVSGKYDVLAIVGGLGLWAALVFGLHTWLIGVSPLGF